MNENTSLEILSRLDRIAAALEKRSGGAPPCPTDWSAAETWLWQPGGSAALRPSSRAGALPLGLLVGLEQQADILMRNTRQFAKGFGANDALLWGARGTGKSSLVKSIHAVVAGDKDTPLKLIEIFREDLASMPALLEILRAERSCRFLLFCDDLSFDERDDGYKSLKVVLEGGIEERPENVLFYATSNRRHLMPRQMIENERASAIHPGESVEEKVSLSDRFGLWLGFYPCSQEEYLEMTGRYAKAVGIPVSDNNLRRQAVEWSATRGAMSGRVAWQFIRDLAGRHEITVRF